MMKLQSVHFSLCYTDLAWLYYFLLWHSCIGLGNTDQHPCPRKVVFYDGSDFKGDFTPLLKDFYIKTFLTKILKNQANALVERVHKIILNKLVTKIIYENVFDHIDPWGKTLASIAW